MLAFEAQNPFGVLRSKILAHVGDQRPAGGLQLAPARGPLTRRGLCRHGPGTPCGAAHYLHALGFPAEAHRPANRLHRHFVPLLESRKGGWCGTQRAFNAGPRGKIQGAEAQAARNFWAKCSSLGQGETGFGSGMLGPRAPALAAKGVVPRFGGHLGPCALGGQHGDCGDEKLLHGAKKPTGRMLHARANECFGLRATFASCAP